MSYDISLVDPVSRETLVIESPHFMQGGIYQLGGTTELSLNITYNYSKYYYEVYPEKGIREIYNKTGFESISIIENLIYGIESRYDVSDVSDDYFECTAGNAVRPLYQLLAMARMRPDGIWDGD